MTRRSSLSTTENLTGFLRSIPAGSHVAVDLGDLSVSTAMEIGRQVAGQRGEQFLMVGHDGPRAPAVARSLMDALPLSRLVPEGRRAWVLVDAATAVQSRGADAHAHAEHALGRDAGPSLTVVCFYTAAAMVQVSAETVHGLHSLVTAPGQ